jgi:crossover junction endodeoxyribonuclease RusA
LIELPWFPNALRPNARPHFMAKATATKKARQWAFLATKEVQPFPPREGPIKLIVCYFPKTAHALDMDNCIAASKAYFDGIAQALGVNDSRFVIAPHIAQPVKGGRITVQIVEQEARPIGELVGPIMADIERQIEKAA